MPCMTRWPVGWCWSTCSAWKGGIRRRWSSCFDGSGFFGVLEPSPAFPRCDPLIHLSRVGGISRPKRQRVAALQITKVESNVNLITPSRRSDSTGAGKLAASDNLAGETGFEKGVETQVFLLHPLMDLVDLELVESLHVATGGVGQDAGDQVSREGSAPVLG